MTRPSIETRILSLYTAGNEGEALNISVIARSIGAAYPHVHSAVNSMVREGLLSVRKIAKGRYCSVSLKNDLARNLLVQAHLRGKGRQTSNIKNLHQELQRLVTQEPRILGAFLREGNLSLVLADLSAQKIVLRQTSLINISFYDAKGFQEAARDQKGFLRGANFLLGYDRLLLLLSPIQERLFQNYATVMRSEVRQ